MPLDNISYEDKFLVDEGRVYLTAMEALTRLPLMQRRRDLAAGLNTAGYISGYRGSPLGRFDTTLWQADRYLRAHHVIFQPGVNEDLAATAISGTQQTQIFGNAKYDGVFALWYGKGPGVDRAGDALRHAQFAGTSNHGGVLMAVGDDQGCSSSTLPQYSEHALRAFHIPILYPATVAEMISYGLLGWAASRFAGLWVAMKLVADLADAAQPVELDQMRPPRLPEEIARPEAGFGMRWPDPPLAQQDRLWQARMPALSAFFRANGVDRTSLGRGGGGRLGIIAAGKAHQDVLSALQAMGLGEQTARQQGIAVYKPGLIWPLDAAGLRAFADGFEAVLVVDEGMGSLEAQVREALYDLPDARRPRVLGKRQPGAPEASGPVPILGELSPARIARILQGILGNGTSDTAGAYLEALARREAQIASSREKMARTPYFCSGCPHNTSTRVPEGSQAFAGIGCHVMALNMDRSTRTWTQMGGEGMTWCGLAPFSRTAHAFVNLGDGTYYHSGYLAIRAAVAAGVNVTYKILYNDAVAMTGGQPMDGPLSPQQISRQIAAEGVQRIAIVTDELEDLPPRHLFAEGATFDHRDDLDRVQKELRTHKGVSALVYVQTCATEKRRRRKRGLMADPDKRVIINDRVCEGCGDCGVQSNCLSVVPLETEFGRKRAIDQSACNKDYSCLKGFCPSFVTVEGGELRQKEGVAPPVDRFESLPDPERPGTSAPYGIILAGIGGTGVVTVSSLVAVAAYLDGKGVSQLDLTGMAQKFGSVLSHIWVADRQSDLHATRIPELGARLLFGPDLVTSASDDVLASCRPGVTAAILNEYAQVTGDFTRNEDLRVPSDSLLEAVRAGCDDGRVHTTDATGLAVALMGDAIGANMLLLGLAYQKGLVPVSEDALFRAIEFNGVAVEFNRTAFRWGRLVAIDPDFVAAEARGHSFTPDSQRFSHDLDEMVARREADLTAYQDAAYGARYRRLVDRVRTAEKERTPGRKGLAEAVAKYFYKLLAYKDEYEVARLFSETDFAGSLAGRFVGNYRLRFHMAPPLLAKRDANGTPQKREFGAWLLPALKLLARMRRLRGTPFDPFGYTAERQAERRLIEDYEETTDWLLSCLDHDNHALALEIASVPEHIRGFGHVKIRHLTEAKQREAELRRAFETRRPASTAAE